ncbi:hypothetical protein ABTD85_21610, partial [Acinetobacter baumannii]
NAAVYANPDDYEEIAEKMKLLYRDETFRNEMINNGKVQCKKFSWDNTADLLWQSILKTTNN